MRNWQQLSLTKYLLRRLPACWRRRRIVEVVAPMRIQTNSWIGCIDNAQDLLVMSDGHGRGGTQKFKVDGREWGCFSLVNLASPPSMYACMYTTVYLM